MNKARKLGLALAFAAMSGGVVLAEGSADAASFISTAQSSITTFMGLLAVGAIAVLGVMLGYRLIPFAYR